MPKILVLASTLGAIALGGQSREGSLAGQVRLTGNAPASPPPAPVTKPADAAFCGSHVASEVLVLGEGGAVKNVILYLDGIKGSTAPPAKLAIANHGCRFEPHVQTATVGSQLFVRNDDTILHNTHAYVEPETTLFNLALPFRGVEVARPLAKPGLLRFKCDAGHTWMSAYLMVLPHRFHAVSDAEGRFRIEAVPPGTYPVKVWHETLGTRSLTVTIEPGQETSLAIELKASSISSWGPTSRLATGTPPPSPLGSGLFTLAPGLAFGSPCARAQGS